MPYKNPQSKREWERQHRAQRIARRRELRQIDAAWKQAQPKQLRVNDSGTLLLLPMVAGGALAAYNRRLAIGAGGLTLMFAIVFKKGWNWWIVGTIILALGFFFYGTKESAENNP